MALTGTQKQRLNIIGKYLGGYTEVSSSLPFSSLAFIANYPSDVFGTASWLVGRLDIEGNDALVDLTNAGYTPDTRYDVLDKDHNFIYSGTTEQYYGLSSTDKVYIASLDHGDYFFVKFHTTVRDRQVLIWMARRVPQNMMKTYITQLNNEERLEEAIKVYNQILLNTIYVPSSPGTELVVWALQAPWQESVTVNKVIAEGEEIPYSILSNGQYEFVCLLPRVSTFYTFATRGSVTKEIKQRLKVSYVEGIGQSNWRRKNTLLYYIEMNTRARVRPVTKIDEQQFDGFNLNLFGRLDLS